MSATSSGLKSKLRETLAARRLAARSLPPPLAARPQPILE